MLSHSWRNATHNNCRTCLCTPYASRLPRPSGTLIGCSSILDLQMTVCILKPVDRAQIQGFLNPLNNLAAADRYIRRAFDAESCAIAFNV